MKQERPWSGWDSPTCWDDGEEVSSQALGPPGRGFGVVTPLAKVRLSSVHLLQEHEKNSQFLAAAEISFVVFLARLSPSRLFQLPGVIWDHRCLWKQIPLLLA